MLDHCPHFEGKFCPRGEKTVHKIIYKVLIIPFFLHILIFEGNWRPLFTPTPRGKHIEKEVPSDEIQNVANRFGYHSNETFEMCPCD